MEDYEPLLAQARAARDRARVPYSGFSVGAAALTVTGTMVSAGNVEVHGRKSFHAEERACCKVATEDASGKITAVAVACSDEEPHVPCGRCLGVIYELGDSDTKLIIPHKDSYAIKELSEQLPEAYIGERKR